MSKRCTEGPCLVCLISAGELVWTHGRYLLPALAALLALLVYLANRRTRPHPASAPQDAEAVVRRQEAMEASRRRMQREQDAKAAVFREKRKQQEEEKRRQKIEEWDSMQLGKSFKGASGPLRNRDEGAPSGSAAKPKSDKKPLRSSEYSPLSGEGGGSCSWRPARRGPSSGG
ncbi:selenoprotein S isoform X2 [Hippocampus comes]|uniref:selenoprotein S isoform X2 n=1 Tax=Hippocampus comes TaxID=109280 RepID=UPI00094F1E35|nr:PREDICTED: selenoprotein S isoform X2 [Hippocampus comes]